MFKICENFKNTYFEEHLQTTTSKKIVIEGISYFVKQLGSCTCTSQSCMFHRSGCSCCNVRLIEKELCNIKIFHDKAKTLDKEIESKLEQYSKGYKGNINSKVVK